MNNDKPQAANEFDGNQLIHQSDRIVINAKKDHLLASAYKTIYLGGKEAVHIVSDKTIIIESQKIYLTKDAIKEKEAGVLGDTNEKILDKLISDLIEFSTTLQSTISIGTGVTIPVVVTASQRLATSLISLKTKLKETKSKKVFLS